MAEKSSIFDMIGPVMIGPSSSHTAGVVKIGLVANRIFGEVAQEVQITFYNSFARTYEGHGSDRAIIAGLLGFKTDDLRIKNAFDFAEIAQLKYSFRPVGHASLHHPNTVKLNLYSGEKNLEIVGVSKGGGIISIREVNGFHANFSASNHTLLILAEDRLGSVSFIAGILAQENCNIADMNVSRKGKNEIACQFIEIDSKIRPITLQYLESLSWIKKVTYIPVI